MLGTSLWLIIDEFPLCRKTQLCGFMLDTSHCHFSNFNWKVNILRKQHIKLPVCFEVADQRRFVLP